MKKINIAIVGVGNIGSRHAILAEKFGTLIAVCDVKEERMEKYSCKKYTSLDTLLAYEKPDLVSICTPNSIHAEQTVTALKAGCNVLVEKPMALTTYDCEWMIHTSEKMNKRLFIVKQNRFNPPVKAVKKAFDEGRLGKIINVQVNCFWNRNEEYYLKSDWRGKLEFDGGTLFTQYSHFIDLMYWFVGDIIDAKAFTGNYLHKKTVEFEDTGAVSLRFCNGAVGTINYTTNSCKKNMEGSITLFCEKGTVKIGGTYLNTLEYQSIEGYEIPELEKGSPPNIYGGGNIGTMSNHDLVYKNVIDVLVNGGHIEATLLDGLKTVQIIEKIYREATTK